MVTSRYVITLNECVFFSMVCAVYGVCALCIARNTKLMTAGVRRLIEFLCVCVVYGFMINDSHHAINKHNTHNFSCVRVFGCKISRLYVSTESECIL